MDNLWIRYKQIFERLSILYRVLILSVSILVVLILWQTTFWRPIANKNQDLEKQINALAPEVDAIQKQVATYKNVFDKLKLEAKSLSANAKDQMPDITAPTLPQRIVNTLKQLAIERRTSLTILSFEAMPSKTIPTMNSNNNQNLLGHDVTIKLASNYFSTLSYIRAIEKLHWPIYWDELSYRVTQYPQAEVMLKMHTISFQGE